MHLQIYYRFITVPVTAVLTIVSGITEAAAGVQGRHASTTFGDSTLHHSTALNSTQPAPGCNDKIEARHR